MNIGMVETQEGRAVLPNGTEETFARFTHWAYAGFYNSGEFSKRSNMEAQEGDEWMDQGAFMPVLRKSIQLTLAAAAPSSKSLKKPPTFGSSSSRPTKKEALKEAFSKLRFCEADDERPNFTVRANNDASEEYTDVFLSYARLYVFAERWDIQPLKRLALKNLYETLSSFTL